MNRLQQASKLQPDSPFILLAMAKVQLGADQQPAARQSLKKALQLVPGWLPAATTLAAIETSSGNLPAALDIVRELRRIDPKSSASFALEGDVYNAANRPTDAASAFVTAYRREPSALLATRAAQAKRASKQREPESELVDWVTRTPTDALARRTLAEYHMAAGRNDLALSELERAVETLENDSTALNNLAWLYQLRNDSRALPTAERAYAGAPNSPAIADTYGWILLQSSNVDRSQEVLRHAATLAPDNLQIQYHYANALLAAQQSAQAVQILRRIVASGQAFESRSEAQELLTTLEKK